MFRPGARLGFNTASLISATGIAPVCRHQIHVNPVTERICRCQPRAEARHSPPPSVARPPGAGARRQSGSGGAPGDHDRRRPRTEISSIAQKVGRGDYRPHEAMALKPCRNSPHPRCRGWICGMRNNWRSIQPSAISTWRPDTGRGAGWCSATTAEQAIPIRTEGPILRKWCSAGRIVRDRIGSW